MGISCLAMTAANAEDIVGYCLLSGDVNDQTHWNNPARFSDVAFEQSLAAKGVVQSASGSNITVADAAWTANQFVFNAGSQPKHYVVAITSGAAAGKRFDITANTTNRLTVNRAGVSFSGISAGTRVSIFAKWTLDLLFPNGLGLSAGTEVILPADLTGTIASAPAYQYRSDLNRWVNTANTAVDAGGTVIPFGNYVVIKQDSGTQISPLIAGANTANPALKMSLNYNVTDAVPEIRIENSSGTELTDGSATPVNLGSVNVTQNSSETLTVRNTGSANLTGLALSVSGSNAGEFVASGLSATTLTPGETATFIVTFTPATAGNRSAILQVASNDGDENPYDINLAGVGGDSEITIDGIASGGIHNYGFVSVDQNASRSFTIRNDGNLALTGLALSLSGAGSGKFSAAPLSVTTLSPNASTSFNVSFTPGELGSAVAAINIASNDRDENPYIINLAGIGGEQPDNSIETPSTPADPTTGSGDTWSPEAGGIFSGLIMDSADDPVGIAKLTVSRVRGTFSSRFTISQKASTLKGALDENTGTFSGQFEKDDITHTVVFALESIGGNAHQAAGTIVSSAGNYSFRATQSQFHSKKNPAPWEGRYTMVLPDDPTENAAAKPQGNGSATGRISKNGSFKMAARLGDGTKVTLSAKTGWDGSIQLFKNLYRINPKGWVGGIIHCRDVENVSDIDGEFDWVKNADPREKRYPDGFEITQPVVGSLFEKPFRNQQLLSSLADVENNAVLSLTEGNIAPLPDLSFTWTNANKGIYTPNDSERVTFRFSKTNGSVYARYYDRTQRRDVRMYGVVLQKQQLAAGYFLGDGQTGAGVIKGLTAPSIEVRDTGSNTLLSGNDTVSFGNAGAEGGFAERRLLVTNTGPGKLAFTKPPHLSDTSGFAVISASGGVLNNGESAVIRLLFEPNARTGFSSDLSIYTNDLSASPFTLTLDGTGVAGSSSSVTGGGSSFSAVSPGDSADSVVTQNTGSDGFPKARFSGIVRETSAGNTEVGHMILSTNNGATSFSARLYYDDGRSYPFRNSIAEDGSSSGDISKPTADLINWQIQLKSTGSSDVRVAGTLIDGARRMEFELIRDGFNRDNLLPENIGGRYTMIIPGESSSDRNVPHGDGVALVNIATSGVVKTSGRLGDGTNFTHSAVLSRDLEWQLFRYLYRTRPRGSISGKMTLRDVPNVSDFDGGIQWVKRPHSAERYFDHGFTIRAHAVGSKYTAPETGSHSLTGLSGEESNAEFSTNDPGITPNPGTLSVNWSSANKLTIPATGTEKIRMVISRKTGLVTGSYIDKTNGVRSILRAVVFQKQQLAGGHSNSKGQTGSIQIIPVGTP